MYFLRAKPPKPRLGSSHAAVNFPTLRRLLRLGIRHHHGTPRLSNG